uniref:Non-specific serine/threonine protein kinase n=1 Tax=Macrostomum lignano TaxID=282301 RepID=A0A1I8I532_9PLAT
MTPEEAMQHPWISERAVEARFRQPGDVTTRFSPTAGAPVAPPLRLRQSLPPAQKQQQQQQDKRERKSPETTTTAATTATGAAATAEPVNPTAASNAPVDEANVELDKDTAEDAAGDAV